jgi:hypothetical protein
MKPPIRRTITTLLAASIAVAALGVSHVEMAGAATAPTLPAPRISISGTATLGKTVQASVAPPGISGVSVRYSWLAGGSPVQGGTAASHQIVLTDAGRTVQVRVTFAKSGYTSRSSVRTVARPPALTVKRLTAAKVAQTGLKSGAAVWYAVVGKSRWIQTWTGSRMVMYVLRAAQNAAYLKAGGHSGPGVPTASAECRLNGRICVQHYTHGTIFTDTKGPDAYTRTRGTRGEIIAAAKTQIGYRARLGYYALHNTKYNEWSNSPNAWCSFFQAWAAARSGNGKLLPKHRTFTSFKSRLRATGTRLSGPKVGAYVLLSVSATYSHVGLITKVAKDGGSFSIIEGNWGSKVGTRTLTTRGTNAPQQFWDLAGI